MLRYVSKRLFPELMALLILGLCISENLRASGQSIFVGRIDDQGREQWVQQHLNVIAQDYHPNITYEIAADTIVENRFKGNPRGRWETICLEGRKYLDSNIFKLPLETYSTLHFMMDCTSSLVEKIAYSDIQMKLAREEFQIPSNQHYWAVHHRAELLADRRPFEAIGVLDDHAPSYLGYQEFYDMIELRNSILIDLIVEHNYEPKSDEDWQFILTGVVASAPRRIRRDMCFLARTAYENNEYYNRAVDSVRVKLLSALINCAQSTTNYKYALFLSKEKLRILRESFGSASQQTFKGNMERVKILYRAGEYQQAEKAAADLVKSASFFSNMEGVPTRSLIANQNLFASKSLSPEQAIPLLQEIIESRVKNPIQDFTGISEEDVYLELAFRYFEIGDKAEAEEMLLHSMYRRALAETSAVLGDEVSNYNPHALQLLAKIWRHDGELHIAILKRIRQDIREMAAIIPSHGFTVFAEISRSLQDIDQELFLGLIEQNKRAEALALLADRDVNPAWDFYTYREPIHINLDSDAADTADRKHWRNLMHYRKGSVGFSSGNSFSIKDRVEDKLARSIQMLTDLDSIGDIISVNNGDETIAPRPSVYRDASQIYSNGLSKPGDPLSNDLYQQLEMGFKYYKEHVSFVRASNESLFPELKTITFSNEQEEIEQLNLLAKEIRRGFENAVPREFGRFFEQRTAFLQILSFSDGVHFQLVSGELAKRRDPEFSPETSSAPVDRLIFHTSTSVEEAVLTDLIFKARDELGLFEPARSTRVAAPTSPQYEQASEEELQDTLKQLHDYLMPPEVEAMLEEAGIEHVVLNLQGQLRYVPFAALYDGDQYFVEKYELSRFSWGDFDYEETEGLLSSAVGFGMSEATEEFAALPGVKDELDAIFSENGDDGIFAGAPLVNEDFTLQSLEEALQNPPSIFHIASHFDMRPGAEAGKSFLLLGDGSRLTLNELNTSPNLSFQGVNLLVLSACSTARSTEGTGIEVEGLGAIAQLRGAEAVMATLWNVADASTAELMTSFYSELANPDINKTEALQNAQLSLLRSDEYSHPYYWAPYILMGNWK